MANKSYRLYLELEAIAYIQKLLDSATPLAPELANYQAKLATKMKLTYFKATAGVTQPAHTKTPKVTLAEKLELYEQGSPEAPGFDEQRAKLYVMWLESPDSITQEQLKQVQAYRYTENLMTPEEEEEYEKILTA